MIVNVRSFVFFCFTKLHTKTLFFVPPPSWSSSRRNNRTGISVRIYTSQAQTHTPLLLLFMICVYFSSSCSFMSFCCFNASKLVVKCTQRTTATSYFAFDEFAPAQNIHFAKKWHQNKRKRREKNINDWRNENESHEASQMAHKRLFDRRRVTLVSILNAAFVSTTHETNSKLHCKSTAHKSAWTTRTFGFDKKTKKKTHSNQPVCSYACYFFLSSFALWIYVGFCG